MKYKNISSAIHNFGHSFLSLMNYVEGIYVVDELTDIRVKGHDIEIDWLNKTFAPEEEATKAILKALDMYCSDLNRHLHSQDVELDKLQTLKLFCPARGKKYMFARDDRDREYKIFIT